LHDFDEWACSEKGVCFVDTISLYYFTEAAKDLNFTQTASRLFLSQQNLSSHIARLESKCGWVVSRNFRKLVCSFWDE